MARKRRTRLIPYWLRGEGEVCGACGGRHAEAVTIRCIACDRPFCGFCVIAVDDGHHCSECGDERSRR